MPSSMFLYLHAKQHVAKHWNPFKYIPIGNAAQSLTHATASWLASLIVDDYLHLLL